MVSRDATPTPFDDEIVMPMTENDIRSETKLDVTEVQKYGPRP
jgi:hypothetical protein